MKTNEVAGNRPWRVHYTHGIDADFKAPQTTWNALMTAAFERYADEVLIEYYGKTYTYAEMRALAARAAAALRAHGVGKGDRVALHLPNCPWHPIFFFGALALGAAVTHLSPLDADREIAHKLKVSGAKVAVTLTTPELANHFKPLLASGETPLLVQCPDPVSAMGRDCPVFDGAMGVDAFWAGHEGAAYDAVAVDPGDLALLQFTGGTTGVPKAAVLSHANLTSAVLIFSEKSRDDPSSEPGKNSLVYSPLFHIMGLVVGLLKRTHEGGTIHLRLRYDPLQAVKEIEDKKITSFGGVPTTWIALLQVPDIEKRDLSSLEYAGSGGAPMPVEVYRRVLQLTGCKVRGGWGMTETAAAGTAMPPDMPEDKLGTVGIPLPGIDIRIVDTDNPKQALAPGEIGEMVIKGPNVLGEYWNNPEETAAAFVDGWLLTGDIGYMDEDGYFYLVDRKKDMILSSGFNVYPLMIEKAVHQHPDVSEAIAIGVPDDYRGESAKVFVVLNTGARPFTLESLQGFLEDKLGRHEIPRHLEFREELPHTPVGKPDRKALKIEEKARRETVEG